MRKWMTALALGLVAALAPDTQAGEGGGRWVADFDEAVKLAKAENKDLLVDFTGSDWCGWCIRLDEEVFQHESFYAEAEKNFVLVALDFPRAADIKAQVPNPERNDELKNTYGISGFPTILLMTADGEVFGRTGYQPGGPESYLNHVTELTSDGKAYLVESNELLKTYRAAEGDAKSKAFLALLDSFEKRPGDAAGTEPMAEVLRKHLAADEKDAKGLNERIVRTLLDKGHGDENVYAAGRALDPKNESGLFEQVVWARFRAISDEDTARAAIGALDALEGVGGVKDEELALQMYFPAAWLCAERLDMPEDAKKFAEKAKKFCPEDDQERMEVLDRILRG